MEVDCLFLLCENFCWTALPFGWGCNKNGETGPGLLSFDWPQHLQPIRAQHSVARLAHCQNRQEVFMFPHHLTKP